MLHVILLFVGIPLFVIIAVSLLILAPGWGKAQRYRPGQPWQATAEWFGGSVAVAPAVSTSPTTAAPDPSGGNAQGTSIEPDTGGASAGW
jgi:hypothetical protein